MPRFLIVGATGQQGGGVIKALQTYEQPNLVLRAISRNPQSPAANALKEQGIEVFKADLSDPESLQAAFEGCEAAYLVTDFRGPGDVKGEVEQGKNFVDAAKQSGMARIVFSSVAGSEDPEVEHFHSKFHIEQYIRESGLSWTIIRPAGFMDLIPRPGIGRAFFLGAMKAAFGDVKQKWVACEDIGKVAARALLEPEKFSGKIHDIVGDVATVDDVRGALARAEGGSRPWIVPLPRFLVMSLTPYHYKQMFKWLAKGVQPGEVQTTKMLIPDLLSIEAWARKKRKDE